jgi:hypothetical protein
MNVRTPDGLEYNEAGYLMSPAPENWIAMFVALIGPLLIVWRSWVLLRPMSFIQHTSVFEILVSRGLLSHGQVAATEIMLAAVVIIEIAGFPYFIRRNSAKYSSEHPAPEPLRKLWPKQIALTIAFGAFGLLVPFVAGAGIRSGIIGDFLSAEFTTWLLICISMGLWFLTEGILTSALYFYYSHEYWSRTS